MLRDARQGHGEARGKVADRRIAAVRDAPDALPGPIRERGERRIMLGRILNDPVQYTSSGASRQVANDSVGASHSPGSTFVIRLDR